MGVVLILIVFFAFKGIDKFTRHGEAILVPDVKGLSVAEATSVFQRHGLTCAVSDSTYVENEVPGRILDYKVGIDAGLFSQEEIDLERESPDMTLDKFAYE